MRGSSIGRLLFVALLAACVATLSASPILTGTFNISGNITVDNPGVGGCPVTSQCITWTDPPATAANKADIAGSGLTGVFAGIAGFSGTDAANISNLTSPPETVGGGGFGFQPFMSFNNGGVTTTLLINFIAAGIYSSANCFNPTPAIGQNCTSANSLFNFVNNPGIGGGLPPQATATWVLSGMTNDGKSLWSGNFTAQFGVPFQSVFAQLGATGSVTNSYSATFTLIPTSGTPEPPPSVLMGLGLGLVVLAAGIRQRFSRS
jgi:MYXO-CTERM domain-containing protein